MGDMLHRLLHTPLAAGILFCSFGCSPAENAPAPDVPEVSSAPVTQDRLPLSAGQADLREVIAAARQDLAGRRGIEVESIEVLEAAAVNWRSGAIGCPQPGMFYTQALVPGYRILVQAGSEVFSYHGRQGAAPFLCPSSRVETPAE
jgi:hypothetical protein